jgi:hypothetical protein
MVYKVAKSTRVRGTLHNNIDRAMDKLIEMGTRYSVYKKDSKGYWLKMYIPQYRDQIAKGIYRKIPKSKLN